MNAFDHARHVSRTAIDNPGFHQSWFPVALARELEGGAVLGVDFLGTRVVVYRAATGKPVVQSAWCPHLGADLSIGELVNNQIRCAYHHWRFDDAGACAHIPTGDKIPSVARIFTYPTAEAWGLVWAFNGEKALFDVPRIPGIEQHELACEPHLRGIRAVPHWVPTSNGVDFQHLRTLHNLQTGAPDTIEVLDHSIEYCIETASYMQHGLITGTNVFAQHLRRGGAESFMLFAGAPVDQQCTRSFFVVGVPSHGNGDLSPKVFLKGCKGCAVSSKNCSPKTSRSSTRCASSRESWSPPTGIWLAILNMSTSSRNMRRLAANIPAQAPHAVQRGDYAPPNSRNLSSISQGHPDVSDQGI